jgi:predicted ABC-type ATPase
MEEKSLSKTPAPKKDRIYGSKKNPKGSASSEKSAKSIKLSSDIIASLSKKLKEFKENHKTDKVNLNDLKAVYRRGLGAYSSTHRPTISGGKPNTRNAWAMARVNAFLRKAGGGEAKKSYVQDDDLLKYAKGGLLAPNGKKSNLTPEQYKLVRTPEFKAWFGDWENDPENASKVLDENGEPLVVYHGSTNDFNEFELFKGKFGSGKTNSLGHYFTKDTKRANRYGVIVKSYFLKSKNPKVLNSFEEYFKWVDKDLKFNAKEYYEIQNDKFGKVAKIIQKNKFDGLIVKSPLPKERYTTYKDDFNKESDINYVVYKTTQIKLADGSNTTFDGSNPDIRYKDGGEVNDCINYIKNNQSIFDNGYYFDMNDLSKVIDPYGQVPLNLDFTLVSYNSGGQSNLDVIDTINPTTLVDKLSELLGIEKNQSYVVVHYVIDKAKRLTDIQQIKTEKIVIVDRDKIICENLNNFKDGGEVDDHKETYKKWKSLVNMSYSELDKFYNSKEGKEAGLSSSEAKEQGIDSGRESARWILKMKKTPHSKWTPTMWKWAKKQISFISRMSGNKGGLYDEKGNKTRKHTSLLIWGHNPKKESSMKYEKGGLTGDFHSLTDKLLSQKIEMLLKKVEPYKFYYVDESRNALYLGFDEHFSQDSADKVYKEATSSAEFFDADGVESVVDYLTSDTIFVIPFKRKVEYEDGGVTNVDFDKYESVFNKWLSSDLDLEFFSKGSSNDAPKDVMERRKRISEQALKNKKELDELTKKLESQGYNTSKMWRDMYNKDRLYDKSTYKKSMADGGMMDVRMEDTVQRMDDPNFADISFYNNGGRINYSEYYKEGGETNGCEKFDSDGERKIDRKSIEQLTECVNKLPQTKDFHFHNGQYDEDRKKLHKEIIYKIKKDLVCVEREQPIAIMMGGSPASGKSTFLKKYRPYLLEDEILKIDADEIRSQLPEYEGYNATQTHLETKDIVNLLLSDRNIGIPCRFDLIYDGTMNNVKSYLPLINLLKSLGYKIFVVYIDNVPKGVIEKRALERYKRSGRFVPLEVIDDFFSKGKTALNEIKNKVDGYMIVDGSNSDYHVIEKGGISLPKNRKYSKIGEPIKVTTEEVVREYKKGGEIEPDDPKLKGEIVHKSGKIGGMLVGKRHSEGGIKAYNKSTGQPLEMEGGEVVITRNAVSDNTKREFDGKMMTNKEILSKINESGGGVSFAKGGKVQKDDCGCNHYNEGGDVKKIKGLYPKYFKKGVAEEMREHEKTFRDLRDKKISLKEASELVVAKHLSEKPNYYKNYEGGGYLNLGTKLIPSLDEFIKLGEPIYSPFNGDSAMYKKVNDSDSNDHKYHRLGDKKDKKISNLLAYETYLYDNFGVLFSQLPPQVQNALTLGKQALIDNYINS